MPTRDTPWSPGTPCWVDYSAADLPAAQQFYGNLLGWSYTEGNPEFGGYLSCVLGDRPVAGMAPAMDPSTPPSWTTYFATDDVDATTALLTKSGGTVVAPSMDVGSLGRMAIALDPQGHPFGLWQSGDHTGIGIYNEPGALIWNDAAVEDVPAAQSFYREVFGFRFDEMPDMGGYATFATDDGPLGGLGGPRPGTPPGWTTCFAVASTDDAVAKTQAGGGTVTTPATDTEFGRFAVVGDPWGAPFSLMQAPPG